jgi:hypothetical protein
VAIKLEPGGAPQTNEGRAALSRVLVALYRGVLYKDQSEDLWNGLLDLESSVSDHFGEIGLRVVIDEGEGYAFLRYPETKAGEVGEAFERASDEIEIPRLIQRRQLTYQTSLMLALLRKRMAEFEASSEGTRLIVTRDEIASMMDLFMPGGSNEAKQADKTDANINRVREMGFLRGLKDRPDEFEVMRIIKAFVDADWLGEMERRFSAGETAPEGSGE